MNKLLLAAFAALISILVIVNVRTDQAAADAAKASKAARHDADTAPSHPTVVYQGDQRYGVPASP